MNEAITLREAIERLESQGISVKWVNDLTMSDFFSYYDAHYFKAVRDHLNIELPRAEESKHPSLCLRFLREDLLSIFA